MGSGITLMAVKALQPPTHKLMALEKILLILLQHGSITKMALHSGDMYSRNKLIFKAGWARFKLP